MSCEDKKDRTGGPKLPDESYVPGDEKIIPDSVDLNPSPVVLEGQQPHDVYRDQTERIMRFFHAVLPDNYVSQVRGPFYTLQFQAAAEQLAKIQIDANEVFADQDYDFTRPEFLYQILGYLVFPDYEVDGTPSIPTDIGYRDFLRRMVILLLQGATCSTIKKGIELVTDADIDIIEKAIESRTNPDTAYTIEDQFEFEISVSNTDTTTDEGHYHDVNIDNLGSGETTSVLPLESVPWHVHEVVGFEVLEAGDPLHTHQLLPKFPNEDSDPFRLWQNVQIILQALKPAHTIYEFRFLFREHFGPLFEDEMSWDMELFHYDDFRKFCLGARELTGTGDTLSDRSLFRDASKSFESISVGAELAISSGPNVGRWEVEDVLVFPVGDDSTPRSYTTSPTGLTGTLTISGDTITDESQDFAAAAEGETLTITEGPNAGVYLLWDLLGSNGGRIGFVTGPGTSVRIAPSLVRLTQRMADEVAGQSYRMSVDRLGIQVPQVVTGEDASEQFYL